MSSEQILPIMTLVLGWFLNSLTPYFQEKRDNRRALGKAIADLLEIRNDLYTRRMVMEGLKKIGQLCPSDERNILNRIAKIIPQTDDLSKRYDEAVTLISSSDPLLGFQLRSKDQASKVGSIFSKFEASTEESVKMLAEAEAQINRAAIPHVEEVIGDLSRRYGFFSGIRIRRYIKIEVVMPKEADDLFSSLKAEIERMRTAHAQTTQGQTHVGNKPV